MVCGMTGCSWIVLRIAIYKFCGFQAFKLCKNKILIDISVGHLAACSAFEICFWRLPLHVGRKDPQCQAKVEP